MLVLAGPVRCITMVRLKYTTSTSLCGPRPVTLTVLFRCVLTVISKLYPDYCTVSSDASRATRLRDRANSDQMDLLHRGLSLARVPSMRSPILSWPTLTRTHDSLRHELVCARFEVLWMGTACRDHVHDLSSGCELTTGTNEVSMGGPAL